MNKEEILSQGYLAAYITGDLSQSEMDEMDMMIQSDAEVAREYRDMQKTLEQLSFEYKLQVNPEVKQKTMESTSIMNEAHHIYSHPNSTNWKYAFAASISLAFVSTVIAFYFWNQWIETDNRLADATIRNIELAENYQNVNFKLEGIRKDLAVIVSPEFSRIILNGTDNSASSKAVIYWNAEQEEVYLNSANLASLDEDLQYQLWALIDGVPVDMGVFDAQDGSFQIMKSIGVADAFAVTIEKSGGAESPTLSTMQVYGET